MRILKICRIAFLLLAVSSLASCDKTDPDGMWDPMVWKAEVPVQKTTNDVYEVSAVGTEFTFSCQNYSSPWIEDAVSSGEYFLPPREANDYHTITTDWFKAEISGNQLKVVFEANDTAEERPLQLTVTAGDIFYTFRFKQAPNAESTLEEAAATSLVADTPLTDKIYLGSGYDVTGAYLSNACLRENVIDLSRVSDSDQLKLAAFSGMGSTVSGVDTAWGFLNGLRVAQGFTLEGEPGDVYFAGTFTSNPLFKDAAERVDDYSFLMYMDLYTVYSHRLHMPMNPSHAQLERMLTDEFKQALAEESPERIVERFGTHVLIRAEMGLNILSLYRSGLKANTSDEDRFMVSMFRRMNEIYHPIFWNNIDRRAIKGGALAIQFHGGNTQRLSADLARFPLPFEESSTAIANWWNTSGKDQTNLSLALLQGDDLIPIYQLIPDETKRADVQRAVKAYIHSHQLR